MTSNDSEVEAVTVLSVAVAMFSSKALPKAVLTLSQLSAQAFAVFTVAS